MLIATGSHDVSVNPRLLRFIVPLKRVLVISFSMSEEILNCYFLWNILIISIRYSILFKIALWEVSRYDERSR
jgi:hypothetical protein